MTSLIIVEIVYVFLVLGFCLRIIYDTNDSAKTLAYLMLIIFLPVAGMIFYMFLGMNFRKRDLFKRKSDEEAAARMDLLQNYSRHFDEALMQSTDSLVIGKPLVNFLVNDGDNPLTTRNDVQLLINGEEKFPAFFEEIDAAKDHIHLAYYIIEYDKLGTQLLELLAKKAKQGVSVRLLYDDFGSKPVRGCIFGPAEVGRWRGSAI